MYNTSKKPVIVGLWDATRGEFIKEYIYHNMTRKKAIICFLKQEIDHNYNTWDYPNDIDGIYKSKSIKDRIYYDLSDNQVIYSQYA